MPLTPFGKQVRKYRLDADVKLSDMAAEFGVKPSYLSAVETGRKPLNDQLVQKSVAYFSKYCIDAKALLEIADRSRKSLNVESLDATGRLYVADFARKLPTMPKDRLRQIRELMKG